MCQIKALSRERGLARRVAAAGLRGPDQVCIWTLAGERAGVELVESASLFLPAPGMWRTLTRRWDSPGPALTRVRRASLSLSVLTRSHSGSLKVAASAFLQVSNLAPNTKCRIKGSPSGWPRAWIRKKLSLDDIIAYERVRGAHWCTGAGARSYHR